MNPYLCPANFRWTLRRGCVKFAPQLFHFKEDAIAVSHHPTILESKQCEFPTVRCQCGWHYTIDPETKQQIWGHCKRQERYPGDLASVFNGYLLGVHAMHTAQLVTQRLDGKKQSTWLIQSSNVETEQVKEYADDGMTGYPGLLMQRAVKTRSIPQFVVSLVLRVPPHASAARELQAVIQSGQIDLLLPL